MTISLITVADQGGVRDYSDKLIESLAIEQQTAKAFVWQQDCANLIKDQLVLNDCLYLQYSGYGYAKRGAPLWLLQELQKHRSEIRTMGVFFHELYAFGPPWSSAFWLSPAQRYIARSLAEQSDFWITNREGSALWLRSFVGKKPHAVLPTPSNVGEMPDYSADRAQKVIVFGGSALRVAAYRAAGDAFFVWAKRQGLEIHDIGPAINEPTIIKQLKNKGVIVHGRLPEMEISRQMLDALFGVVAYPVSYVAKSGVFAAYCAHGICPVLISQEYPEADGLIRNQHYLAGIPEKVCTLSVAVEIGQMAFNWYQPHRIAKHVAVLTNLLGIVGHVL